jgi:hypothetical protein
MPYDGGCITGRDPNKQINGNAKQWIVAEQIAEDHQREN